MRLLAGQDRVHLSFSEHSVQYDVIVLDDACDAKDIIRQRCGNDNDNDDT